MSSKIIQSRINFYDGLVVDNFAGGGGASTGIELALSRPVDLAINHDEDAIAMHQANHPFTRHFCESVWDVDPKEATDGKKVLLAWFSPDCTHFSKARGCKPADKNIRGLAWVAVKWAATVKPRVIMLENVEEIKSWGPLDGKLKLWRLYSSKPTKLYILCGFESQDETDIVSIFERLKIISKYECLPYLMRHELYQKSEFKELYIQLARYLNQPAFFKKMSFRTFCEKNQSALKNQEKTCSSMRALMYFEAKHPEIAKSYFDTLFFDKNQKAKCTGSTTGGI